MKSFLGILPLNVGTIILVSVNITLAIDYFLVNVNEFNPKLPIPWLICIMSSVYTIVTWVIVYYGTYKKSVHLIKIALNLWMLYTILWIISAVFSLTDSLERYLCVCHRCSDSLWLFATDWHNMCKINTKLSIINGLKNFNDAIPQPQPVKNPDVHSVTFKQDYFDYVALSVIIVLSNLILGIITLSNYLIELKCITNCPKERELISVSSTHIDNRRRMKIIKSNTNICNEPVSKCPT